MINAAALPVSPESGGVSLQGKFMDMLASAAAMLPFHLLCSGRS